MDKDYPDEIVLPSQPIEVHIPDAEPDSKPIQVELPETTARTPGAVHGAELSDDFSGEPLKGNDNVALDEVDEDDDGDSPVTDTPYPEDHEEYGQNVTGDE